MSAGDNPTPAPAPAKCPFLAGPRSGAPRISLLPRPGRLSFWAWYRLMRKDSMVVIPQAAFEEDILETKFLWTRGYLINDPDGLRRVLRDNAANYPKTGELGRMMEPALGEGLLTGQGDTWHRHRRLMSAYFDQRSVSGYVAGMTAAATEVAESWARLAPGSVVDVLAEMKTATARAALQAFFSSDWKVVGGALEEAMAVYQADAMPNFLDLMRLPEWLAGAKRRRIGRRKFGPIRRIVDGIIAERIRAGSAGPDDLLGHLIRLQGGKGPSSMTAAEVRDEMFGIFVASHETTALTLGWTWYLLSLHPEARVRLEAELQSVLRGRPPAPDDIPKLGYATMVIQETMRLYPPVFAISHRRALADDEVCGRRIPAGAYVSIVPWALHRHRKLWDQPDRFDPERFSPAGSEGRHKYAFLPFSAGPRVCIGASFAMSETVAILATLAQRYRLRLVPEHPVETVGLITLRPRQGMKMALERMA